MEKTKSKKTTKIIDNLIIGEVFIPDASLEEKLASLSVGEAIRIPMHLRNNLLCRLRYHTTKGKALEGRRFKSVAIDEMTGYIVRKK